MLGIHRRERVARARRIAAGGANAATLRTITITAAGNATTVAEGATLQLSAAFANSVGTALTSITPTWSSSSPAIATVNGSGLVTVSAGVFQGTVYIFARVDSVVAQYRLDITPNVTPATVAITPNTLALTASPAQSAQLVATVRNTQGRILWNAAGAWTSAQPSRATVAAGGVVQAVGAGAVFNVSFTTTVGSIAGTCAVTVS